MKRYIYIPINLRDKKSLPKTKKIQLKRYVVLLNDNIKRDFFRGIKMDTTIIASLFAALVCATIGFCVGFDVPIGR